VASTTVDVLLSSVSEMHGTPDEFFNALDKHWGPFDLDPAASDDNAKCPFYYTEKENGLIQPWIGRVFVNPPFNRKKKMYVGPWVAKAWAEVQAGNAELVCMLVPSKTDVKWWHEYVLPYAYRVVYVEGRIPFVNPTNTGGATFPSAVVIFNRYRSPTWKYPLQGTMRNDGSNIRTD